MHNPIHLIAGARPNFMKIAPIVRAFEARGGGQYRIVHTGQHYDEKMSESFFRQLGIPKPDVNLEVGSGTQAEQTAGIMVAYEKLLMREKASVCVVVGDVTSTMACSIAAQKMGVKVAHVEGGIRSGDWSMPEEINRMVTDSISNWFFTTSEVANENLRRSGVSDDRIFFVGNTMIDTLLANRERFRAPEFWEQCSLSKDNYIVLTLHRPSNVDDPENLVKILHVISETVKSYNVVFPVHPRTKKVLEGIDFKIPDCFIMVEPQAYLEFNFLVENSKAVITDSGGITEETTVMGIPCITLRDSTERPETVTMGTNELIGTNPDNIKPALEKIFNNEWKKGVIPPLWDGKTAERIVDVLLGL